MSACVSILLTDAGVEAALLRGRGRSRQITKRHHLEAQVPPALAEEDSLAHLVHTVVEAVRQVDGVGRSASLIVPSTWCYYHRIELAGRRFHQASARFSLEEHLPLPLESVTCTFCPDDGEVYLGMAVRTAPVRKLLDRLAEARVLVESVHPDAFVAPAAAPDINGRHGVILLDASHMALVTHGARRRQPRLLCSRLIGGGAVEESWPTLIDGTRASDVAAWSVLDLRNDANDDRPNRWPDLRITRVGRAEAIDRLHRSAAARTHLLPDLRHGPLACTGRWGSLARSALWCTALAAALLLVWTTDLHRQRRQYDEVNHELRARQTAVFEELFPGQAVPRDPALRLASERIRIEGLTRVTPGQADAQASPTDRYAALDTLRDLAGRLPDDVRVLLIDWDFDGDQLSLRGRTRDHRDAERIADCVGRVPGIQARPPRTSRLEAGGVEFSIRARRDADG